MNADPLHDNDAERYFLAAAIQSAGRTLGEGHLVAEDFHNPAHEKLFTLLLQRVAAGEPMEPAALAPAVAKAKGIGPDRITDLVSIVTVASSASYYAARIRARSIARQIRAAAHHIAQQVTQLDLESDLTDAANYAAQHILSSVAHRSADDNIAADLRAILDDLEHPARYVPTPWSDLNRAIGGWSAGRLYLGGARPAVGKSLLGLCAALHAARNGARTLFVSVEMSKAELYLRLVANAGHVDHGRLQRGGLSDDDWANVATSECELSELPLHVVDDVTNPSEIFARALNIEQAEGKLGLIVVDYVQLMRAATSSSKLSRQEIVADFSRSLKIGAKAFNVPILALAQLNRDAVGRRPVISDLRESGALEQDADLVMLLHRDPDLPEELDLMVAKNRHGTTGAVTLYFDGKYQKIRSWSTASEPAR